jgi:hypothetical protein
MRRALEAELSFLGQVFGFEPADDLEPIEMPGLAAWRRRRAGRGSAAVPAGRAPRP